ncbi:hypothetical protein PRIPAC_89799 [Pristionchus pacificus]|nr:hypothetical protein PRIPAC_89799 [Pristionchus pacificus]
MSLRPFLLIVVSFALFEYTAGIDCTGKINKCPEDEGCAAMFPPKADGSPNDLCTLDATHTFAILCNRTCNNCCNVPCADHNNNCAKWKVEQDYCNPKGTITYDMIWNTCAKTCELCE